jgi:hypothetical protein
MFVISLVHMSALPGLGAVIDEHIIGCRLMRGFEGSVRDELDKPAYRLPQARGLGGPHRRIEVVGAVRAQKIIYYALEAITQRLQKIQRAQKTDDVQCSDLSPDDGTYAGTVVHKYCRMTAVLQAIVEELDATELAFNYCDELLLGYMPFASWLKVMQVTLDAASFGVFCAVYDTLHDHYTDIEETLCARLSRSANDAGVDEAGNAQLIVLQKINTYLRDAYLKRDADASANNETHTQTTNV